MILTTLKTEVLISNHWKKKFSNQLFSKENPYKAN